MATPRPPEQIRKVISTIRHPTTQQVKCPVCASLMVEKQAYQWECPHKPCPIDGVDFNERVHSYETDTSLEGMYG